MSSYNTHLKGLVKGLAPYASNYRMAKGTGYSSLLGWSGGTVGQGQSWSLAAAF